MASEKYRIDLAEEFPHLNRAPIAEAVIDIRAHAGPAWEEKEVLKALPPDSVAYSTAQPLYEVQQQVTFNPGATPSASSGREWVGIQFSSDHGHNIVEFARDGFSFHRLPPYEDWGTFYDEAMRLWKIHAAAAHVQQIQRIGLRFINRIQLSPTEARFEDYIQHAPSAPAGMELPHTMFFHHDTLLVPGHPYEINIIRTIQPPQAPTTGLAIILDIGVSTVEPFNLDENDIGRKMVEMRWLKNKVFFGSITKKAIEDCQ
jgi:uncharacterized protein (TIGR04255 family)